MIRAEEVLDRLAVAFEGAADPAEAEPMARYMRGRFAFLGIKSGPRRALQRTVLAGLPAPDDEELRAVCLGCWDRPEREYQYVGTDYFNRYAPRGSARLVGLAHRLVSTRSWWDTVDALAAHGVGGLVRAHPALVAEMDGWIGDDDLWVARTALLHQLRYKTDTDPDRLFDYCRRRAAAPEFFLRKAIGWALREYSKTAPDAVRAFVDEHEAALSGLSRREALKVIERG